MPRVLDLNPFRFSGPLSPEDMIDRDPEAEDLLALAEGATRFASSVRVGTARRRCCAGCSKPRSAKAWRRCSSTYRTCCRSRRSWCGSSVAISGSRARSENTWRTLFRSWNIGLSFGGGGFTATLQRNPNVDAESVLLRLLELPAALFERNGTTSLIVFDEIQDVLAVPGADGKIRSVIQHQGEAATYGFAGSAPGSHATAVCRSRSGRCSIRPCRGASPRSRSTTSATTSRRDFSGPDGRRTGARPADRVHPRPSPAEHDARALPVGAHTPRGDRPTRATWVSALDHAAADTGR